MTMKYLKGSLLLFFCSISGCGTWNASSLIVPGQGMGPFRLGMTKADIQKLVKPEAYAEGEQNGLAIISTNDLDSTRRVEMELDDQGKVRSMSIHGDRSVWHSGHGISLGTTLSKLAELNGRPIRLHAFDVSEKRGWVLDWGNGLLAKEWGAARIIFASPMRAPGYDGMSSQQKQEIEKDRDFLSTDPEMRALNPWIETIEICRQ